MTKTKTNRREFIKKASILTAGGIVMPYILPSGRLFAQSGNPKAKHVVMVMFAGGVRHQESILQQYLAGSQIGTPFEGNIMYNILKGNPPGKDDKRVYGTNVSGQPNGSRPIPQILSKTIQEQGTLFPEMTAITPGHYFGNNSLITGNLNAGQGLKARPTNPTIFEYVRRFTGAKATDTWFVGNGIGNSIPLLSSSLHPKFGLKYGGNFLAPNVAFGGGAQVLSDAKIYHPEEELEPIYNMKNFLDNSFTLKTGQLPGIKNTDAEKTQIKEFVRNIFQKKANGTLAKFNIGMNGDMNTARYTAELLSYFKPKLTVLLLNNVDVCHSNFTGYLRALHRADHAVGWLWNYIQNSIPEMANNTIMLMGPECGRNLNPNPIEDTENNFLAYDHSNSKNTKRVFGAMVGPNVQPNLMVGNEANKKGFTVDFVPTIADILGFKDELMKENLLYTGAKSLFDRI